LNKIFYSWDELFLPFKIFLFYLLEFFVNGFFFYNFELIIVSSILIFAIFFNYSFNKVFYYLFNSKKKNLSAEYVAYIVGKQTAQDKLKYFCYLLDVREQFFIECFLYVYSFMKVQAIIASVSKIVLLCYLYKERLIFFFKEYALINRVRDAISGLRIVFQRYALEAILINKLLVKENSDFFNYFESLEVLNNK
jgi:hypothetical protein